MPKPPIFWNRCDVLNTDTIPSVIGADLVRVGTNVTIATTPSKYGNCVSSPSTINKNVYATLSSIAHPNEGTLEFWFYTGGINTHQPRFWYIPAVGALTYNHNTEGFWYAVGSTRNNYPFLNTLISTNTWQHFAFVWWYDSSVNKTKKDFYIDNVLKTPNARTEQTGLLNLGTIPIRFFGIDASSGGGLCGYLDNLKIYDYRKTDFSDRFKERGGMNDFIKKG